MYGRHHIFQERIEMKHTIFAIALVFGLSGCASIIEGQQKAADVAFGKATTDACRVVRADALLVASKEQWPDLNWTAADKSLVRISAAPDLNIVISEYSAAMIVALMPVFVDLGRTVVDTIEESRANGWGLETLVPALMHVNGVPQRMLQVRNKVAECEASNGNKTA